MNQPASETKTILEERARKLAQRPDEADAETIELLNFDLGTNRYSIETRFVLRVVPLSGVCPLPSAPEFFAGVANVGGQIVPVADLCKLLGIAAVPISSGARLVVLGKERHEYGFAVDATEDIVRVPLPRWVAGHGSSGDQISRSLLSNGRMLLDGKALLEDQRLFATTPTTDGRVAAEDTR